MADEAAFVPRSSIRSCPVLRSATIARRDDGTMTQRPGWRISSPVRCCRIMRAASPQLGTRPTSPSPDPRRPRPRRLNVSPKLARRPFLLFALPLPPGRLLEVSVRRRCGHIPADVAPAIPHLSSLSLSCYARFHIISCMLLCFVFVSRSLLPRVASAALGADDTRYDVCLIYSRSLTMLTPC